MPAADSGYRLPRVETQERAPTAVKNTKATRCRLIQGRYDATRTRPTPQRQVPLDLLHLADTLKAWRAGIGLTRAEAAQLLGISLRTLEKYEIKTRFPRYAVLERMAKVMATPHPPPSFWRSSGSSGVLRSRFFGFCRGNSSSRCNSASALVRSRIVQSGS